MTISSNTQKNSCDQARADPTIRCWSDLPVDLSRSVAERLIYPDFLRFRAVCKYWQRAFSDDDDHHRRAVFSFISVDSPHHLHGKLQTVCTARFFDLLPSLQVFPITNVVNEEEQVRKDILLYTSFCCSDSGWLLLLKSHFSFSISHRSTFSTFFIHNPVQNETMKLNMPPSALESYEYRVVEVAGFSTTPTSRENCVIFLLWKYGMRDGYNVYDPNYRVWAEFAITTTYLRMNSNQEHRSWSVIALPPSNPKNKEWKFINDVAYVDGIFYCAVDMDSKVILGTFNVALQEWDTISSKTDELG